MYALPLTGLTQANLVTLLSVLLGPQQSVSAAWHWGMAMLLHFSIGSMLFPLLYVSLVSGLSGFWWGVLLWVLAQAVFMPIAGLGFFSARALTPLVAVIESLLVHLIYGSILELLVGSHPLPERQPELAKDIRP